MWVASRRGRDVSKSKIFFTIERVKKIILWKLSL